VLWTLAAIVAALFIYLMVLLPVLRDLALAVERDLAAQEAYAQAMAAAAGGGKVDGENAAGEAAGPGTAQPIRTGGRGFEADLQAVKDLAKQEPQIVANVVKDWVGKE